MSHFRNHWAFLAAGALALVVIGFLVDRQMREAIDSAHWVSHTHEVLEALKTVEARLNNAESEQRAYVLLGDLKHLEQYYARVLPVAGDLGLVRQLVADHPAQSGRAARLTDLVSQRRARLNEVVEVRQTQGSAAAVALIAEGKGGVLMEQIRTLLGEMEAAERNLLAQRAAAGEHSSNLMRLVTPLGGTVAILLLLVAVWQARREARRRLAVEQTLRGAHEALQRTLAQSECTAGRRQQLHQLSELLQSCKDLDEAAAIVQRWMQARAPGEAGMLSLLNASENLLEIRASWGDRARIGTAHFALDDCWALRRGTSYAVGDGSTGILCAHAHGDAGASLCLPLMAQGQPLGVLHLRLSTGELADVDLNAHVSDLTAQLSLAVSNLRLQDSLRTQSIRDPLTGLFNRRYLEASMQRELARAQRTQQPVALMVLDLDHFKRFNDTHGHDAGDALLTDFGQLLRQFSRSDDVACRYGGEEFVLLLPEMSAPAAAARADQLLSEIRALQVRSRKDRISGITASIGLALFPQHGRSGEVLIRAADQALYQAKHGGRDRCVLAEAA